MSEIRFSSDKIWDVILKLIMSPSFITALAPFLVRILGKWFPGLSPELLNGLITALVGILPILFSGELAARLVVFPAMERQAKFRAGWTEDASGKMQAPPRTAA